MNIFQKNVVSNIENIVYRLGLTMTCETLDDETVKVKVEHLDVFIYSEELQIQGPGIDERYEKYDFTQNKNLLQVFLSEFETFILNKNRKSKSLFLQIKNYALDVLSKFKKY